MDPGFFDLELIAMQLFSGVALGAVGVFPAHRLSVIGSMARVVRLGDG